MIPKGQKYARVALVALHALAHSEDLQRKMKSQKALHYLHTGCTKMNDLQINLLLLDIAVPKSCYHGLG